jgi:hypothetical protein
MPRKIRVPDVAELERDAKVILKKYLKLIKQDVEQKNVNINYMRAVTDGLKAMTSAKKLIPKEDVPDQEAEDVIKQYVRSQPASILSNWAKVARARERVALSMKGLHDNQAVEGAVLAAEDADIDGDVGGDDDEDAST